MQSKTLLSRGRAALILYLCFILVACGGESTLVPTIFIPTTTPAPTLTAFPTVTPIPPRPLPATGRIPTMPGLPSFPGSTPASEVSDPQNPPPDSPVDQPAPTAPPVDSAPQSPAPEAIPTGRLNSYYLGLIPSRQGLWAMRPDGKDMTLLTADPIFASAVSPGGSMIAYVTHSYPGTFFEQPYGHILKIYNLRTGKLYDVALLDPQGLSPQSTPEELDAAAQGLAAYQFGGLAWAPDGRRLAFVSSHESPPGQPANSDVYVFTPTAGKIERLSSISLPDGPAHAYGLEWSPEGQRLYYAAAYSFGSPGGGGSGIWMGGSWVSWLTGSLVQVSDGSQPGPDQLLTWPSWSEVLLNTANPVCGKSNLRMVNLRTGAVKPLWPGCYADAMYERGRGQLVLSVTPNQTDPTGNSLPGVYIVPLYRENTQAITNAGFESLFGGDFRYQWYGFNRGEGLFGISRSGAVTPVFTGPPYDGSTGMPMRPLNRMDTGEWMWSSEGGGLYRARPGEQPQPLMERMPQNMTSSPTVPGLYFFFQQEESGPVLYGVRTRDWEPFVVETRISEPGRIIWLP